MELELVDRLEKSIQFIMDGIPFTVGDFVIGKSTNGRMFVNCFIPNLYLEHIDKTLIEKNLLKRKMDFIELMNKAKNFSGSFKSNEIDYYLLLDSGSASIQICGEVDGNYEVYI